MRAIICIRITFLHSIQPVRSLLFLTLHMLAFLKVRLLTWFCLLHSHQNFICVSHANLVLQLTAKSEKNFLGVGLFFSPHCVLQIKKHMQCMIHIWSAGSIPTLFQSMACFYWRGLGWKGSQNDQGGSKELWSCVKMCWKFALGRPLKQQISLKCQLIFQVFPLRMINVPGDSSAPKKVL